VLARLALLVLAVQISGCALPAREKAGALRAEVVARLGPPTASFPLPSGERLLYSELPAGFAAYNLDFDASGRLVRNEQVLTQARFENLPVGIWTTADVQRTFGAPLRVERVARFEGDIWTYRFRQNSDPRLAHVHLDRQGVVRLVVFTDELPHFDNARD
jgi:hypothetical protein